MKKILLSLLVLTVTSLAVNAEGLVYDPTEFQTSSSEVTSTVSTAVNKTNQNIENKTKEASIYAQNSVAGQSSSFNNALYELDSAQVNIRNELLDYQAKYQEIDTQYKLLKEQRRVLAQQIREINRKVNSIERSKNQIRKTMS